MSGVLNDDVFHELLRLTVGTVTDMEEFSLRPAGVRTRRGVLPL